RVRPHLDSRNASPSYVSSKPARIRLEISGLASTELLSFCPASGGTTRRESIRSCQRSRKGVGAGTWREKRWAGGTGKAGRNSIDGIGEKKRGKSFTSCPPVRLRSLASFASCG